MMQVNLLLSKNGMEFPHQVIPNVGGDIHPRVPAGVADMNARE